MFQYTQRELCTGIERAEKQCGGTISQSLAEIFLEKLAELKEGYEFREALRYSLNECRIKQPERKLYRVLAGFFFGRRGNFVRARLQREAAKSERQKQRPPRIHKPRKKVPQPEFFTEPGGQRAFRI